MPSTKIAVKFSRPKWARKFAEVAASTSLGLLLALIGLEIGLRLVGFGFGVVQDLRNPSGLGAGQITVLSLGESSTALYGNDSYPRQLEEVLAERAPEAGFRVINSGMPGVDSYIIMGHLDELLEQHDPDIVTVMMGINDDKDFFAHLREYPDKPPARRWIQGFKIYKLVRFLGLSLDQKARAEEAEQRFDELVASHLDRRERMPLRRWYDIYGSLYRRHGRYEEALAVFLEFSDVYPCADAYFNVGRVYRDTLDEEREEEWFRRAVEEFPDEHTAYRGLSRMLRRQGKAGEAEELLQQQVDHIPDLLSHLDLANFYLGQGDLSNAEQVLIASNTIEATGYGHAKLAQVLELQGRWDEAEAAVIEATRLDPCGEAFAARGRHYLERGDLSAAEEAYIEAIALGEDQWEFATYARHRRPTRYDTAVTSLASLYQGAGREDEAYALLEQIVPNPMTLANYRTLTERVLARGARVVAVQYPMRSVSRLQAMVIAQEGVGVVDNQQDFRQAVARDGYNAIFTDAFAGDFGHCTRKGNRIIAENIADVVLAEYTGAPVPDPGAPVLTEPNAAPSPSGRSGDQDASPHR